MSNRIICESLYEVSNAALHMYKCKLCSKERKQLPGRGYSNLLTHLCNDHPDYKAQAELLRNGGPNASILDHFVIVEKVQNIVDWMDWILELNLPWSFVDQDITRRFSKLKMISSATLKDKMFKLKERLVDDISSKLPEKFGILFDAWSNSNIHYLATYAVVPTSENFPFFPLLQFMPLKDEEDLSAESYNEAFDNIMHKFKKDPGNISFMIGDNCSTNIKASIVRNIPLIGCGSHRLNLAVQLFLKEHHIVLEKLNVLMKKLKTTKGKAFLKKNGFLMAKIINQTRWSSTFKMIERYLNLISFENGLLLSLLESKKNYLPLLLSPLGNNDVKEIFVHLQKMNSVSLYLQKKDTTLAEVRVLFDKLIFEYPIMKLHLSTEASIVKYPAFENGIVKIQNQQEHLLDIEERKSLEIFLKNNAVSCKTETSHEGELDFAGSILQSRKSRKIAESSYIDLGYIAPTSNMVERLFSVSKDIITDKRKTLKMESVDLIMFLKANRQLINSKMLAESFK
jgi:hypothetical protein